MSGFPTRIFRSALGPLLEDLFPIRRPQNEIGQERANLLEHTAVGSGLVVPRALVIAEWSGSVIVTHHQSETWNTDGTQTHPTLARASTGVYSLTFASSYLDHTGASHALTLIGARATSTITATTFAGRVVGNAYIDTSNPLIIRARFWDGAGDVADARFILEVW